MITIVSTGKTMPQKIARYRAVITRVTKPKLPPASENIVCDGNLLTQDSDNQAIKNLYGNCCIHCGNPICTIHEIRPRSTGKKSMRLSNRVPVCLELHDFIHTQSSPKKFQHRLQIWQAQSLKLLHHTSSWNKLAAIFLDLKNYRNN